VTAKMARMELGMVGLGRMGANMVRRVMHDGHVGVVYNRGADAVRTLVGEGATGSESLADLVSKMEAPRHVWVMVPAGAATEGTVQELGGLLSPGDCVIDGGNSYYKDDVRRSEMLKEKGIHYLDVGTSGGIWGLERGYCLMIGGPREVAERMDPIFASLAPGRGDIEATRGRESKRSTAENGYLYCGPSGAGHFVKMVHNGIEYGLMQAYAEGFEIMEHSEFDLDLHEISGIWRNGSVVRSWLLELLHAAFEQHGAELEDIAPYVEDSGEGRWTITEAMKENVPAPVISAALFARFASRDEIKFSARVAAALRQQFGGHAVRALERAKAGEDPR
jgi:6-phosphogluconate dehydrogenase